jgi:hypothetical protein
MKVIKYPCSRVQVSVGGSLAIAQIGGVITPDGAAAIIRDSVGWGGLGGRPMVKVVDYSMAAVALTYDQLLISAGQVGMLRCVPAAAIVATPETYGLFRSYAAASTAGGVLKAVFLSIDEAVRWAARQAVVLDHWQRRRDAVRSGQGSRHAVLPVDQ